jgi:hypothetical protein
MYRATLLIVEALLYLGLVVLGSAAMRETRVMLHFVKPVLDCVVDGDGEMETCVIDSAVGNFTALSIRTVVILVSLLSLLSISFELLNHYRKGQSDGFKRSQTMSYIAAAPANVGLALLVCVSTGITDAYTLMVTGAVLVTNQLLLVAHINISLTICGREMNRMFVLFLAFNWVLVGVTCASSLFFLVTGASDMPVWVPLPFAATAVFWCLELWRVADFIVNVVPAKVKEQKRIWDNRDAYDEPATFGSLLNKIDLDPHFLSVQSQIIHTYTALWRVSTLACFAFGSLRVSFVF